jgi:hypothetical protein
MRRTPAGIVLLAALVVALLWLVSGCAGGIGGGEVEVMMAPVAAGRTLRQVLKRQ